MTEALRDRIFLAAADHAVSPIWVFSPDLDLVWSNMAAQEWQGETRLRFDPVAADVPPDTMAGVFQAVLRRARQEGRDVTHREPTEHGDPFELHVRWSGDNEWLVANLISLHTTAHETPSGLQALGFGRMLAHELKNPLASIRGAAQLIEADAEDPDLAALAVSIRDDSDRITRLTDHWSQVGDINLARSEPDNVNRIAFAALNNWKRGYGSELPILTQQFDPSLPDVRGDADLLGQCLINLLDNAASALEAREGAEIQLLTRYDPAARAPETGAPTPITLIVRDNGPGIDAAIRPGLFTPFVTSKPAGEGLGLAFCARVMTLHEGWIDYHSEVGKTEFRLRLPRLVETG
jgi:two-component system nitrogen regulation sensor histidine kinase GlnL